MAYPTHLHLTFVTKFNVFLDCITTAGPAEAITASHTIEYVFLVGYDTILTKAFERFLAFLVLTHE